MTLAERAIEAAKGIEVTESQYVAVYDADRLYIVQYTESASGDPWKVRGWVWNIPLYIHRHGSIVGPRPACER